MANVKITDLPIAGPITGDESVPIVQNGLTVRSTTGAIAASPAQTQTFLTVNQEPTLPNSRRLAASTGLTITDGGALGAMTVGMNGAAASLNSSSNGFQVKTGANTIESRNLATSGSGLSVTNGNGLSDNPTFQLTGLALSIANLSGAGLVASTGTGVVTPRILTGVANQTVVTNGNGASGNPTVGIADNPILPGLGAVTLPSGSTADRPVGADGDIRFNTDTSTYEAYSSGSWRDVSLAGGVTDFSAGTTGFTPDTATSGSVLLGGILNPDHGGTGAAGLTGYVFGNGSSTMTASPTVPTTNLSGTVANAQLTNSSIVLNGNTIALGDTATITATATNPLTIGTGLTGTSYNGSAPVTVAIDSTVATLTGTQTLTNKTLTDPKILNTIKLTGSGAPAYTPFIQTFSSSSTNFNGYQLNYIQNINNGSDASVDYVAYNDASDVDSYFVDMGISSSNYTNPIYTVFPPNGGYIYTGGGISGQASALLLGTSNAASDITMFTGGTLLANTRATIKGNTGNFLIGTTTDTGQNLQVGGTTKFSGAATFGSTVTLNADPVLPLQAATKQYVDSAVSAGFTVQPAVRLATAAPLPANTYSNGASGVGATLTATANGALSIDGVAVVVGNRVLIKDEVAQARNGAYTVTATGSAGAPYVLTRAADFDQAIPSEIANNAYFFVTEGVVDAGSSFILSQTGTITVGTTPLPFTQFSDQLNYVGGTNINVTGLTISLSGTVAPTNGGTGVNTVTTGDLLYGSAANTWSKLPIGIAYKSLVVNAAGTQVEWNAVPLNQATAVSGQLNVSNGGSGASVLTGYLKGNGTSAFTGVATIPSTDITGLGTMSVQNASSVVITGGSINNTIIGATTAAAGTFTTVTATTGISGGTF